jgi:hypothetical protein
MRTESKTRFGASVGRRFFIMTPEKEKPDSHIMQVMSADFGIKP